MFFLYSYKENTSSGKSRMLSVQQLWEQYQTLNMSNLPEHKIEEIVYFCSVENEHGSNIIRKLLSEQSLTQSFLSYFVKVVIFSENIGILLYLLEQNIITIDTLPIKDWCVTLESAYLSNYVDKGVFRTRCINIDIKNISYYTLYRNYRADWNGFSFGNETLDSLHLDELLFILSRYVDAQSYDITDLMHKFVENVNAVARDNKLTKYEVFVHERFASYNTINIVALSSLRDYYIPILLKVLKARAPFSADEIQTLHNLTIQTTKSTFLTDLVSDSIDDPFKGTIIYLVYKCVVSPTDFPIFNHLLTFYPQILDSRSYGRLPTIAIREDAENMAETLYNIVSDKSTIYPDIDILKIYTNKLFSQSKFSQDTLILNNYEYALYMYETLLTKHKGLQLYHEILTHHHVEYIRPMLFEQDQQDIYYIGDTDLLFILLLTKVGIISCNMTSEQKSKLINMSYDTVRSLLRYILNTCNLPTSQNKYGRDIFSAIRNNRLAEIESIMEHGQTVPYDTLEDMVVNKSYIDAFNIIIKYPQIDDYRKDLALLAIRTNSLHHYYNIPEESLRYDLDLYNEAVKYNRQQIVNEFRLKFGNDNPLVNYRSTYTPRYISRRGPNTPRGRGSSTPRGRGRK